MVVVITILAILSLIGYTSYSDSIVGVRDSQRINDMEKLSIDLKGHKQKEGLYPLPVAPMNITNSGTYVYQGTLTNAVISNVLANIPKDPRTSGAYWYSTVANRQQFQIALTIENVDTPKAVVKGDYKSITKTLFPTLFLSLTGTTATATGNTDKFILNGGSYNLPYNMSWVPLTNSGLTLATLLTESWVTLEMGGSYLSCQEIYDAGRSMGSGTYQIVSSTGAMVDTGCLMNY